MAAQPSKITDNRYSREHLWRFDGGAEIPASSSPHIVPVPYSNAVCIDPEEAFIAALSSCHMLWFFSIAAKRKCVVESYTDHAIGLMTEDGNRKLAITRVSLCPTVVFIEDNLPTLKQIEEMHDEARHHCFLANSVKTEIVVEDIMLLG